MSDSGTIQLPAAGGGEAPTRSDQATPAARRRRLSAAIIWGTPLLVWQCLFFIVPLALLVAMTFWSVRNFRLSPDFTLRNWKHLFGEGYFYVSYLRTVAYSAIATAVGSALAFPCAYLRKALESALAHWVTSAAGASMDDQAAYASAKRFWRPVDSCRAEGGG